MRRRGCIVTHSVESLVTRRSFDDISLYGPPLPQGGLADCIRGLWNACKPWVERIELNRTLRATDPESFLEAFAQAFGTNATGIACAFIGDGRECRFSTVLRAVPALLGGYAQQTSVFISGERHASLGEHLLKSTGVLVDAWFGRYTPEPDAHLLHLKMHAFVDDPAWSDAGQHYEQLRCAELPVFSGANLERWVNPFAPFELGWCNYWSSRTAELLQFPNSSSDQKMLGYSEHLENGAWLVKLTPDPLNLATEAHIRILALAYERFAAFGRAWNQ